MMDGNKQIEDRFRESLESFELPYDAEAWTSLEKKLPKGPKSNYLKWGFGVSAVLVIVGIISVLLVNHSADTDNLYPEGKVNNDSKNTNVEKQSKDNLLHKNDESPKKIILNSAKEINSVKNTTEISSEQTTVHNSVSTSDNTNPPLNALNVVLSNETKVQDPSKNSPNIVQLPDFASKCYGDIFEMLNKEEHTLVLTSPSGKKIQTQKGDKLTCTLEETGVYTISYTDRLKSTSILDEKSFTVNKSPILELQIADELDYESGLPVLHGECSTNETIVTWSINGKVCENANHVKHDLLLFDKGRNIIEISAQNDFGCKAKSSRIFHLQEDYNLLAVNSFSPSSNDVRRMNFMPYALTVRNVPFVLTVLDPDNSGTVFTSTDASQPWDGIDRRTGNLIPLDKAYIWRVVLSKPMQGEKLVYTGSIVRF